jgi:hypothetical protein
VPKVGDPGVSVIELLEELPPRLANTIPNTSPAAPTPIATFHQLILRFGFSNAASRTFVWVIVACPVRFRSVAVILITNLPAYGLSIKTAPACPRRLLFTVWLDPPPGKVPPGPVAGSSKTTSAPSKT